MPELIISKSKFFSNLSILQENISAKIAAVIKDNAYGHGIKEISSLLAEFGIKDAFVKNNAEANLICDRFDSISVLYPESYDNAPKNAYLSVASEEILHKIPRYSNIELKINTGMNRNGIDDVSRALEIILSRKINLCGVFTHNAYGDCEDSSDFDAQNALFYEAKSQVFDFCKKHGMPKPRFHSLSSSGALKALNTKNQKNAKNDVSRENLSQDLSQDSHQDSREYLRDDLVRLGISIYGYLGAKNEVASKLQPIAELWTNKISTHNLPKGAKIGYDGASVLERDCVVSSYDIGYGDGLFRLNETHKLRTKEGFVVLPKMSMDSTSIISSADKVCIMHDANEYARLFNTIPYEILCKISPFITRTIKD